jgi:NTP pyrophosphatase (non-canonical NTP hydrolase)
MSKCPRTFEDVTRLIREFVDERDWNQYHKPAALAISASIEAGELLELFQWKTDEEVKESLQSEKYKTALSDEIADVMIYLLRLADTVGIDAAAAIADKMKKNEAKYPASRFLGVRPDTFKKP